MAKHVELVMIRLRIAMWARDRDGPVEYEQAHYAAFTESRNPYEPRRVACLRSGGVGVVLMSHHPVTVDLS